jgi:hypothetical protein
MRARVPNEMKALVLERLKHMKFWSMVKWFPVVVILFWALFALAVFVKGHEFIYLMERHTDLSEKQILMWCLALVGVFTIGFIIYILWFLFRMLKYEDHFYCKTCDAVDNEDEGRCPVCGSDLQERATFICTYDSDEMKLLQNLGLKACKEQELISPPTNPESLPN